ncbi:hypothetical protein TWF173_005549 [Orbilia oligospora]|nr:hypothetical protein TWF173_005549 [Orbilia oligospora]
MMQRFQAYGPNTLYRYCCVVILRSITLRLESKDKVVVLMAQRWAMAMGYVVKAPSSSARKTQLTYNE